MGPGLAGRGPGPTPGAPLARRSRRYAPTQKRCCARLRAGLLCALRPGAFVPRPVPGRFMATQRPHLRRGPRPRAGSLRAARPPPLRGPSPAARRPSWARPSGPPAGALPLGPCLRAVALGGLSLPPSDLRLALALLRAPCRSPLRRLGRALGQRVGPPLPLGPAPSGALGAAGSRPGRWRRKRRLYAALRPGLLRAGGFARLLGLSVWPLFGAWAAVGRL